MLTPPDAPGAYQEHLYPLGAVPSVGEAHREIHGVDPSGPQWDSYKAVTRAIGNGGKMLMIHSDAPLPACSR